MVDLKSAAEEIKAAGIGFNEVIVFLLGALVIFTASTDGAGDFHWRYFLFFACFLLAAATLARFLHRGEWIMLEKPTSLFLAGLGGLVLLGALSLAWSGSFYAGIGESQLLASFLFAFYLGRTLLRGRREIRLYMALATAAAAAVCLYGIMQYFFFFEDLALFLRVHGLDYALADRVNSRFITPNVFASFLNLVWPMTLALLLTEGRRALKWLWGSALALELTCLYLTQSRGGWLVFAFATVALAVLVPGDAWRGKRALLVSVVLLTVAACALCSLYSPLGGQEYASSNGSGSGGEYSGLDITAAAGSMRGRLGIWRGGLAMFKANLLWGVGAGGFAVAMQQYQHRAFYSVHAHDYLLETASELGLVGLLLALLLTVLILSRLPWTLAARRQGEVGTLAAALWALSVGFLLHNLMDIAWFNPLCAVVFWSSVGALFSVTGGISRGAFPGPCREAPGGEEPGAGGPVPAGQAPVLRGDGEGQGGEPQHAGEAAHTVEEGDKGMPGDGDPQPASRRIGLAGPLFYAVCALLLAALSVSGYFNARFFLSAAARERADEADTVGDELTAVDEYERALSYWDADPATHQQLGYVLQAIHVFDAEEGEGCAERSLFHLERAIELEPRNAYGYLWKGTLLLNLGRHEEGRAALGIAEGLYPNNPAPPFFAGESFFAQGDYDAALEAFGRVLRLVDYYADVNIVPFRGRTEFRYILYAVKRSMEIHLMLGRKDEALAVVDEALSRLPDNPTLHYYRAYVLGEVGDTEGALEELDEVERLLPGCSGVHLMRGKIYAATGDVERAREEYLLELEIDPHAVDAREALESLEEGG